MNARWTYTGCSLIVVLSLATDATLGAPGGPGSGKGEKGRGDPAKFMERLDANGDGEVSKQEFTAGHERQMERARERLGEEFDAEREAEKLERRFQKLDVDGSGSLSSEEFSKARRGKGREGGPKGRPGDGAGGHEGEDGI